MITLLMVFQPKIHRQNISKYSFHFFVNTIHLLCYKIHINNRTGITTPDGRTQVHNDTHRKMNILIF